MQFSTISFVDDTLLNINLNTSDITTLLEHLMAVCYPLIIYFGLNIA
jgi:hypothetical protein